jgi:hypothetical protein
MSTTESKGKGNSLFANLITCIACVRPMKIERGDPDAKGRTVIQYRCGSCGHIEQLRLRRKP